MVSSASGKQKFSAPEPDPSSFELLTPALKDCWTLSVCFFDWNIIQRNFVNCENSKTGVWYQKRGKKRKFWLQKGGQQRPIYLNMKSGIFVTLPQSFNEIIFHYLSPWHGTEIITNIELYDRDASMALFNFNMLVFLRIFFVFIIPSAPPSSVKLFDNWDIIKANVYQSTRSFT